MSADRLQGLATRFAALKIDALLVSALPNVRYLSGFTGSNGLLVVSASGAATLFTDPRYAIQATEQSASCAPKIVRGPLSAAVSHFVVRKRWRRIGFEKARMIYSDYAALDESLPSGAALKPMPPLVEQLRAVKSEDELTLIRRSVLTNSQALAATLPKIRAGVSESEIAAELEYQMRLHGADKPAFETIVAAGARTALPHAEPGALKLQSDHLLLIDMGASQNGYASDMTRMFSLGKPARKLRTMYNAVLEAQLAAIARVRPGVTAAQVDRAARSVLAFHGLGAAFVHSTGHGLGLEIHEAPRIGAKDNTALEAGMAITIEPGAYIEGFGGVRIEDTIVVTASGCEPLTPTSKELVIL